MRVVVIGAGTAGRGDDAAGLHVAHAIAEQVPPGVTVLEQSGEATALLDALSNARAAIIVDAVSSNARPGTIHRLDATSAPLPAEHQHASTHGFGVAEGIELARALGKLPTQIVVIGIEGQNFGLGQPLSAPVTEALPAACKHVLAEIAALAKE